MSETELSFLGQQRDEAVREVRGLLESPTALLSPRNIDTLESRLDDATRAADRLDRLAVSVGREPMTYERNGRHSYFVDMALARIAGEGSDKAKMRLERHRRELDVELERREVLRRREFDYAADRLGMKRRERRDISRVDGSGGHFAPPLWILDELGSFPRAGRVVADRMTAVPLPRGTDSVNVPRLTTGATVAIQASDGAAISETDPVDAAVTAPARTIAGMVDASIQLAEQAAQPGFDRLIFADLSADYDAKLDAQLIAGTGATGQVSGLLTSPGTTVTYTSATPTVAATYSRIGDLASQVSTARQRVPSVAILHPRRAFWLMSQADGQSRPFNPIDLAAPERDANTEPAGSLLTMALAMSTGVPANLGAGSNEDRVIVTRGADHVLLESDPFFRVDLASQSGTLTARFRMHQYVAFISQRAPSATGVLAGTGLTTPTYA